VVLTSWRSATETLNVDQAKIAGHDEAPEYNQHTPQVANNGLNPFSRKENRHEESAAHRENNWTVLVLTGLVSAAQAQNREKFVISARAGASTQSWVA